MILNGGGLWLPPSLLVRHMIGYIAERAYVRRSAISPPLAKRIRKELSYTEYTRDTVKSTKQYKAGGFGSSEMRVAEIENFWRRGDYVSLPRKWALDNIPGKYDDHTRFPILPGMRHFPRISPRDNAQRVFFDGLLAQAKRPGPQHILANATTGAGKTVAQIWLGQQLATRTLIVVDSNKIANGYLRDFAKFYGDDWVEDNVGRIQQDVCDITKPYVIAMVQSLASRHYPKNTYKAFGLVCYDEVQIYGNPAYHRVLGMFHARVLCGLTATNKSGDFGKAITGYIGSPAVVSKQEVMKPDCHVVTYKLPRPVSVFSDGALINDLVRIKDRNDMLAELIVNKAWKRKRVCLVFSDRVEQLQGIQKRLLKMKVPASAIGLHVGEYEDGTYTVGYSYDDGQRWIKLKTSLNSHLADVLTEELTNAKVTSRVWDRPYIPASVKNFIRKKKKFGIQFMPIRNTIKPTEEELDCIANSCMIILATYRIFGKGVNYPRIDMGVEGTPISSVTQPLGRITRLLAGKKTPEWWAIYDRFVFENTKAERFGTEESDFEAQVEAVNAFFDAKHTGRKHGFKLAGAKAIYHKAEDIRSAA